MKHVIFLALLTAVVACAAAPIAAPPNNNVIPPHADKTSSPPPDIQIMDEPKAPVLAMVNPMTLKVTYKKGTDPKKVVDVLVKIIAKNDGELQACRAALTEKKK